MSLEQALKTIRMLARSQGFYGRLLCTRSENTQAFDDWLTDLAKDCKDSVDLVIAIES
jgi:hypothetical protein